MVSVFKGCTPSAARQMFEGPILGQSDLKFFTQNTVSLWPNPFSLPKVLNPQSINSAIELEAFHTEPACQAPS